MNSRNAFKRIKSVKARGHWDDEADQKRSCQSDEETLIRIVKCIVDALLCFIRVHVHQYRSPSSKEHFNPRKLKYWIIESTVFNCLNWMNIKVNCPEMVQWSQIEEGFPLESLYEYASLWSLELCGISWRTKSLLVLMVVNQSHWKYSPFVTSFIRFQSNFRLKGWFDILSFGLYTFGTR